MAKRLEAHQARQTALTQLGRALARRSGSRCELCEAAGVALAACELPPLPEEPEAERCIFVCRRCREGIDDPRRLAADLDHWRCLYNAVWSAVPAVQVAAVRLLNQLDVPWAADLRDQIYLEPEVSAWVEAG